MAVIAIPLSPEPQRFSITLAGTPYRFRLLWNDAQGGMWILDIGTMDGATLVAGIPLVPNTDLLAQYSYLDFGGALVVTSDRDAGETPTYEGLGTTSRMFFIEAASA